MFPFCTHGREPGTLSDSPKWRKPPPSSSAENRDIGGGGVIVGGRLPVKAQSTGVRLLCRFKSPEGLKGRPGTHCRHP